MYFTRCGGSGRGPRRSRISRRRCSLRCVAPGRTTTRRVRCVPTCSAWRFGSSRCSGASESARWRSRRLEIRDGGPGPDELLQAKQARAMVLRALERIPLRRRAVLVMHDLEEVPMAQVADDALDSLVHRVFSAAQGAHGAGGGDSPDRQGREQAMKTPPPLSPELEALLAPHRTVLPLAPSVEARALARARPPRRNRRSQAPVACPAGRGGCSRRRPARCSPSARRAYAARAWIGGPPSPAPRLASRRSRRRARASLPAAAVVAAPRDRGAGDDRAARSAATSGASSARRARRRSARRTRSCSSCGRRARTSRAGDFAGALAVIAEHVRRFRNGEPGRRARGPARQVPGGARASRRSAARGGRSSTPGSRTACSSRRSNA